MSKEPDYCAVPEEVYNYSDLFKMRMLFCFAMRHEEVRIFAQRFGLGLRRRDGSEVRVPDRPICVWVNRYDIVIGHPHQTHGYMQIGNFDHSDNQVYDAFNVCRSRYPYFGKYDR